LEETAYWLELIEESKLVTGSKIATLKTELSQLMAILTTVDKRARTSKSAPAANS
jgi:hypothetical protein